MPLNHLFVFLVFYLPGAEALERRKSASVPQKSAESKRQSAKSPDSDALKLHSQMSQTNADSFPILYKGWRSDRELY